MHASWREHNYAQRVRAEGEAEREHVCQTKHGHIPVIKSDIGTNSGSENDHDRQKGDREEINGLDEQFVSTTMITHAFFANVAAATLSDELPIHRTYHCTLRATCSPKARNLQATCGKPVSEQAGQGRAACPRRNTTCSANDYAHPCCSLVVASAASAASASGCLSLITPFL